MDRLGPIPESARCNLAEIVREPRKGRRLVSDNFIANSHAIVPPLGVVVIGLVVAAARKQAVKPVKALLKRAHLGLVSEVPLADGRGGVPGLLQTIGNRDRIAGKSMRTPDGNVVLVSDSLLVATCDQAGSARRTHRCGDIGLLEPHTRLAERIEVRRFNIIRTLKSKITVTSIVRHNEDDVGWGRV